MSTLVNTIDLARIRRIKHVALDMDGTIYKGGTLFPWTQPFLEQMAALGIGHTFLTNNPSKSTEDYLAHLARMGLKAERDQLYTSAQATIDYIKRTMPAVRRLFLLGTPSMIREFEQAGFVSTRDDAADVPDALVVGFDMTLAYSRLCRAAWWASRKIPYLATNPDKVCPTDQPTILADCAAICAAIQTASGRAPDIVMGKPDPSMLDGILQRHGLKSDEVAMVGDRIYTDVLMAHRARMLGVLVLSGEATEADALAAQEKPDLIVQNLSGLGNLIAKSRE